MVTASTRQWQSGAAVSGRGDTPRPDTSLPWLHAGALVMALVSAFAVISSTHSCRALYTQLQALEAEQWGLQEDYGRLLLEQSTWASHYRVEKVARADLGMRAPDLSKLQVVQK